MGNPVKWFEVTGRDFEATSEFYSGLFDWRPNRVPGFPYATVHNEDGIGGGIGESSDGRPNLVTFYVEVEDVAAALAKANELGGSTVLEPTPVPSGTVALFADPEGNVVGLTDGVADPA